MTVLESIGAGALAFAALVLLYFLFEFVISVLPGAHSLEGAAVVVTGCDSGIGRRMAFHLAKTHKAHVFAGCLTSSGADALEVETSQGQRLRAFVMDVTSDVSVAAGLEFVKSHLGGRRLFAVINNAGVTKGMLVEFTTMEEYMGVMDVNYLGMVRVTKAFLPLLVEARGRIVSITSVAALMAAPAGSAYAASKFAATAFSDSARRELQSQGVKVVQILPGFMNTGMAEPKLLERNLKEPFYRADAAMQERYGGEKKITEAAEATINMIKTLAADPDIIMGPVLKALRCRYPRARYLCGKDAHFMFYPLSLLPTRLLDRMIAS
ncbi:unnamed protein product [Ostreobium quekettii]|uniref:Uncharacterized protein n=1 Tax=Ostreobium quekettii TaxID=121088 RepID=A0A8S1J4L1_9CHLO|nr:unnamed protein product [Ostreobium quekettii]|eukprot:evm.model.scf_110EXC.1 EVM.evm.TU.scf_110EXC.1   scf_110EXC:15781-19043(+)